MTFFPQIYGFLILRETLRISKFEDSNFKYVNSFFKFPPNKAQMRYFLPRIQEFFIFALDFVFREIRGCRFQI